MPTISHFYGLLVRMFFKDVEKHRSPRIHVEFQGARSMTIKTVTPVGNHKPGIVLEDGRAGLFDVAPYFDDEVFAPLKTPGQFQRVRNGGYYVEWASGADLSADTIEAGMVLSS